MTLATATAVGFVFLAVLVWFFMKARRQDVISAMLEKRKPNARLVSRAEYVEGLDRMPVALALTDDTFFYENADLEASFELARIDEIDYDDELATGKHIHEGERILRLRSHGAAFEFILPKEELNRWQSALPARRLGPRAATA
jgi:hypothetical protein